MLAADIELVDIDGAHWRHWYELLVPSRLRGEAHWALLFVDGALPARPVAGLIHDDAARADARIRPWHPGCADAGEDVAIGVIAPGALADVCRALGVDAVVVVDLRIVPELYDDIARALAGSDRARGDRPAAGDDIAGMPRGELAAGDLVAQSLACLRACKRHGGRGIWTHPPMLDRVPPVAHEPMQRTFDLLIPDHSSLVAYVFEDDASDVHASLIAVKRGGDIDLVTTHLGVEDALSGAGLAQSWRQSYRRLLALVDKRYAPASLAVFLERATFERIATGPSDQLAREINARNVIIDPAPAWLLGLLGGATMAAFASRGAKALARMLPTPARRVAADLAHTAQSVMRDSGAHPFDLLGFDPVALWHDLRGLYQP